MKVKIEDLNGQKIFIIDDFLKEDVIANFHEYANALPYRRHQKDFEGDPFLYYSAHFDGDKFKTSHPIGKASWKLFTDFIGEVDQYSVEEAYVNLLKYGDMQFLHRDCDTTDKHITVLYYINQTWDYTWGGETIFYHNGDSVFGVLPKPGRFVIFPGFVEHTAGLPSANCNETRLSLALKIRLKEPTYEK